MKLLIDTHVLLWILQNDTALSKRARQCYGNTANELYFSGASYWELCIKLSLGKLRLAANWVPRFEEEMVKNAIRWLPIQPRHTEAVIGLPWHHRDPFDRLLVAQCQVEDLSLLTANSQIRKYDVEAVW